MMNNSCLQIGKLELNNFINQLEYENALDLIEVLLMKNQQLEKSKKEYFLTDQKIASIETFRLSSIQEEIENIQFKIGIVIKHLRKFHPIFIGSNRD